MFPRKINSRVAARQPLRGDVLFSSLPRMKKACALMFALIHILSCLKYEKGKKKLPTYFVSSSRARRGSYFGGTFSRFVGSREEGDFRG